MNVNLSDETVDTVIHSLAHAIKVNETTWAWTQSKIVKDYVEEQKRVLKIFEENR